MSETPVFLRLSQRLLEKRWATGFLAFLLLVVSLLLTWQGEQQENRAEMRDVSAQARILAGSLSGAVAFDDRQTVEEYLGALQISQNIKAAGVYDPDGRLLAGYKRKGELLPDKVDGPIERVEGAELAISYPITEGSLVLGRVYVRSSIETLTARLSRYLAIGVVLTLAAMLIALLGASNAEAVAANRRLQEQIAAREQAEEALRRAQKMEALGQLTGGVAHDFNNLLMAASSGLDLLDRAKDDERRARLKQGIRDALDRGSRITEQLLAFSRRRPLEKEIVRIDEHIAKLTQLLDHSLRENVSVDFSISPDVWPIEVDLAQFDIAILNVAVNAKDAMPRGGKLCISARNLPGALEGADAVEMHSLPPLGIASFAFTAMLRMAMSNCATSTSIGHTSGEIEKSTDTFSRNEWSSSCVSLAMCSSMRTISFFSGRRREKASSCSVMRPPRSRASLIPCLSFARRSSSFARSSRSRPLDAAISRLLKSCATPPVSCPSASIFCARRKASSACSRAAICSCKRRLAATASAFDAPRRAMSIAAKMRTTPIARYRDRRAVSVSMELRTYTLPRARLPSVIG